MGKTSVLKKLEAQPLNGFITIRRDLENISSPLEFVERLFEDIKIQLKWKEQGTNYFKSFFQYLEGAEIDILLYIFENNIISQSWRKDSQSMLEIYAQHNLLEDLSGGLVESIKAINEPSTSDYTAQAWLEMWQNLAGQYDEFKGALNLLKVAVEYKINRDRRVLLQLPQEERQILEELLNPESP
jgi:hypothetical protein